MRKLLIILYRTFHIRSLLFFITNTIDSVCTKSNRRVLFVIKRNTVFSANHRVMCEWYLRHTEGYELAIFSIHAPPSEIREDLERHNIKVFTKYNLSYIRYLCTTGVLYISHSIRDAYINKPRPSRLIINYWHGASFKKIENLMHNLDNKKKKLIEKNSELYDYMVSSGLRDQSIISQSFAMPIENVLPIGLPRYDLLNDYKAIFNYSDNIAVLFERVKEKNQHAVLYAPTFRETKDSPLKQMNPNVLDKLNTVMEKNKIQFFIRPHSYDKTIINDSDYSNITVLHHDRFHETNMILNHIDMIIVDYSSIWVDFLIKDKPILFFQPDYQCYCEDERGVNYAIDELPGCVVHDIDTMITTVLETLKNDKQSSKRKIALAEFHSYSLPEKSFTQELIRSIPQFTSLQ